MNDGRSARKAKVIPFIGRIERDRQTNLQALAQKAKLMKLEGFDSIAWDDTSWQITAGRLVKLTGKTTNASRFNFILSPQLGGEPLSNEWATVAKSFFILRFHRKHQAAPNQRNFITAIGYVAHAASELGLDLLRLTPEALENACDLAAQHYSDGTAYNIHKHVAEFSAHCDANGLCRVMFQYKYARMKRPTATGGLNHTRLDDPTVLETKSDKLVAPAVFKVIGELYLQVPKDHKYRIYVLILTLLSCTGRRFSEIALLPNQKLSIDSDDKAFLSYFPRKMSRGNTFTPKRKLYLPTDVIPIVKDVLAELDTLTATSRSTALEMHSVQGPDLRFLDAIDEDQKIYKADLQHLGLSTRLLTINSFLRKENLVWSDADQSSQSANTQANPAFYTNKASLIQYCQRNFSESSLLPFHIDQQGQEYFLHDILMVRPVSLVSGVYAHWLATSCTHSMFTTFLRYFQQLASEYSSASTEVDFTSHHFRHTLNTLLDEGGLSDLLQTEWFGRTNPQDTKAYQHTSREKRALMLRADIKEGLIGGQLAEQIKVVPIQIQDAILKARVQAVHDVGTGLCIHNFSQTPCERHLQCSADCNDYVWAKDDKSRIDEQKRQYALTVLARQTAETQQQSTKPKKSSDWLTHNDKKLKTLATQLSDNGVKHFDPIHYLNEVDYD